VRILHNHQHHRIIIIITKGDAGKSITNTGRKVELRDEIASACTVHGQERDGDLDQMEKTPREAAVKQTARRRRTDRRQPTHGEESEGPRHGTSDL
jgi:hypothetical protein